MSKIRKFFKWWGSQNFIFFVLITVALSSLILIPIGIISETLFPGWFSKIEEVTEGKILGYSGFLSALFSMCVIVPIIETLLFQLAPISLLELVTESKYVQVSVSSVLFGASHGFNFVYVIATLMIGAILATGFIIGKNNKSRSFAFWAIVLSHSISNLIALITSGNPLYSH